MATLTVTPGDLAVTLGGWERFGPFQRDFTVPWDHIDSAEAMRDLWPQVRGWRAPGIGIPHVILLGSMRFRGGRGFVAVYMNKPGVVLEMHGEKFERLYISAAADQVKDVVRRVTQGA